MPTSEHKGQHPKVGQDNRIILEIESSTERGSKRLGPRNKDHVGRSAGVGAQEALRHEL